MKEIKEALEYAKLSIESFKAEVLMTPELINGILTVFSKVEEMQKTLERCLPYIELEIDQQGYGFFPGGDPTQFIPDEDNTPEQHNNWTKACEAWNERKEAAKGSHVNLANADGKYMGHITIANLGMGVYNYQDEEAKEIVEFIQALKGTSQ